MKCLWITALLFLVTGVKSGPPTRKVGDIDALEITEIDRNAQEQFTFTLSIETPTETKYSILVVKEGVDETEFSSLETGPSKSLTFDHDLILFSGSTVDFLIVAKNEKDVDVGYAEADNIPFPEFPKVVASTNLDDPRSPSESALIRLQGTLGTMSLKNADTLITGDTNYYSFAKETPTDYIPCNDVGGVPVCDVQLDATPTETKDDPILSSAVLSYNSETQATIKLTPNSNSIDILEAIVMLESPLENILCTKEQIVRHECTINWKQPSSDVLRLIITQKTSDQKSGTVSWATNSVEIPDRQLAVTQLGADIIEGRWLMLEGEYPGDEAIKSIYRLRKTVIGANPLDYEDIEVDCSHLALEPRLCFGYFPHLALGTKHTLTVAYNGTGTADEMHQIESYPVTIKSPESELEILSRHTTTHQNQQRADVQICFQHLTPTDGRSFSHYEMLIINEKGQWLKHSIMEEEEEEEEEEKEEASEENLCFAPFSISTNDFDLTEGTKVIISQRGADGITVLASGESLLF